MTNPYWTPLEAVLPLEDCAAFMYMGRVDQAGVTIHQYKHSDTRRYLNLSEDGTAWRVIYHYIDDDAWDADEQPAPDIAPIDRDPAIAYALPAKENAR